MIICKNCGNKIEDDVEFCYFCGEEYTGDKEYVDMNFDEDNQQSIVCPICQGMVERGIIEANNYSSLMNINTVVEFYKEEEEKKFFRKNVVSLKPKTEGYYCKHCEKFIGIFSQR